MRFLIKLMILIISVAAAVLMAFGIFILCEKLFLPEDYYFYQFHPLADQGMIYLTVIPVMTFLGVVLGRFRRQKDELLEDMYDLFFIWKRLGRARILLIAIWFVCIYCCVTSATIVTEDQIICLSPLRPSGVRYDYEDVKKVKAAFGQKRFAVAEYKKRGNFYYQIVIGGKSKIFYTPSVNENIERYADDTYLELEEFDRRLVDLGVPKEGDDKGWEACDLDSEYVERFRRIIAFHKKS